MVIPKGLFISEKILQKLSSPHMKPSLESSFKVPEGVIVGEVGESSAIAVGQEKKLVIRTNFHSLGPE